MAKRIVVDTGLEEYEVVDKKGNVMGTFLFNPADTEIVERNKIVESELLQVFSDVKKHSLTPEGADTSTEEAFAEIRELEKAVISKINFMLGTDTAESFFKTMKPFASVKGKFYVEHVVEAIQKIIDSYYKEEKEAQTKRSDEYMRNLSK